MVRIKDELWNGLTVYVRRETREYVNGVISEIDLESSVELLNNGAFLESATINTTFKFSWVPWSCKKLNLKLLFCLSSTQRFITRGRYTTDGHDNVTRATYCKSYNIITFNNYSEVKYTFTRLNFNDFKSITTPTADRRSAVYYCYVHEISRLHRGNVEKTEDGN